MKPLRPKQILVATAAVALVSILVLWNWASRQVARESTELGWLQYALQCYARENQGCLPPTLDALFDSGIARRDEHAKYALIVDLTRTTGAEFPKTVRIEDIGAYNIAFGLRGHDIRVEGSHVLNSRGEVIRLLAPAGHSFVRNGYDICGAAIARVMIQAAHKADVAEYLGPEVAVPRSASPRGR